MRQLIAISLILFLKVNLFGQPVKIDTLILSNGLRFPIIKTAEKEIDLLINTDLKKRFTYNEYSNLTVDSALIKWADETIRFLDFDITYIKNGLISLIIRSEGCGAYCTNSNYYFTYSILDGKYLTIEDIVNTKGKFQDIVIADKNAQYKKHRKELKEMLLSKDIDEESYNIALEYYNNCDKSFALNSFVLFSDKLELIENCFVPHFMQNLTPIIKLEYKYKDIQDYLKIKN